MSGKKYPKRIYEKQTELPQINTFRHLEVVKYRDLEDGEIWINAIEVYTEKPGDYSSEGIEYDTQGASMQFSKEELVELHQAIGKFLEGNTNSQVHKYTKTQWDLYMESTPLDKPC